MLHTHKTRRSPLGAFAVSALTVAGLGLTATGGIAQTTPETAKSETVTIKRIQHKGGKPLTEAERNALVKEALGSRCQGELETVQSDAPASGGARNVTQIVFCGGPGGDRLTRLEKARERLGANTDLGADARAKALAVLEAAIADARTAR